MEKFKDNLPLLSALILILGTANISIYYNTFGIDILSYLTFTEVLQIQFKVFATAGAFFIAFFILFFPTVNYITSSPKQKAAIEQIERDLEIESYLKLNKIELGNYKVDSIYNGMNVKTGIAESFEKRQPITVSKIRTDLIALGILTILGAFVSFFPRHYSLKPELQYWIVIISAPVFIAITILAYFQMRKDKMLLPVEIDKVKDRRDFYKFIAFFISLAYCGVCYARISALSVITEGADLNVAFSIDNKQVKTSDNYRYIGQTKDYIFIYDVQKKQSDIFKVSDVKIVSISKIDKNKIRKEKNITKPDSAISIPHKKRSL